MKIWFVILLYILCACGTSKKSTDTERHATTSVSLSDSIFKKDSLSVIERILSNERLSARILVVEWSSPDSVGNLYPVKTSDITIGKEREESGEKIVSSGSDMTEVRTNNETVVTDERETINVDKGTRLIHPRVWWYLLVGGMIAAMLWWIIKNRG
jgi:lipoprotein|nr:MAG TPA: hypothetical protein [Caudoviricetes sp.]